MARNQTRTSRLWLKAPRTTSGSLANVPLTIEAVSGQTGNLLEIKNSAGTVITSIGPTGALAALDANGLQRMILNPTTKDVPDGAATALFEVACAAAAMVGGYFAFVVEASDGTDHQALSGIVAYSGVNKAGTHTTVLTQVTGEAKSVSSGTLTLAFTIVTGTNKVTVKLQPTGSLTETIERVTYTVFPIIGAVTIL